MGLFYALPLQATPATKNYQAGYLPATYWPYMVNFKLHLYFPGWVGVGGGGGGKNQT